MMFKCLILILVFLSLNVHAQLTNESELGISSVHGNTNTQTFSAKQLNTYQWEKNLLGLRARYLHSKADDKDTARYLYTGLKYELEVSKRLGFFVGEAIEKDRFAGIDKRLISDLGARYHFIDTDPTKLFSELGYRYMHEDRVDGTQAISNYGRVYGEWGNQWNQSFSTKYWAEYLPNFSDFNDWQFNTELSLTSILSQVFSLNVSALLRYDHLPAPGIKYKTDTLFSTNLVAKF